MLVIPPRTKACLGASESRKDLEGDSGGSIRVDEAKLKIRVLQTGSYHEPASGSIPFVLKRGEPRAVFTSRNFEEEKSTQEENACPKKHGGKDAGKPTGQQEREFGDAFRRRTEVEARASPASTCDSCPNSANNRKNGKQTTKPHFPHSGQP